MTLLAVLGLPAPTTARSRPGPGGPAQVIGGAASPAQAGPVAAPPDLGVAPKVVSLHILPDVKEIPGEGVIRFRAIGRLSNKDTIDLSPVVVWDTSDRTAVKIDPDGTAHGQAVTGGATIIATYEEGDLVARRELEVVMLPQLGPDLPTGLEVWPMAISIVVGFKPQLNAAGIFANGEHRNMNASVRWKSTNEGVIRFDPALGPSVAIGVAPGMAKVVAHDPASKLVSKPISVTVTPVPPPPVPPRWVEQVDLVGQKGPAQWIVGQTFRVTAKALYSDEKSEDVTRKVRWSSSQEASIDANGNVRLLRVGRALMHADWSALTSKSGGGTHFGDVVLGAPPKEPPKLPAAGRVNKAAALALVRNLVGLAQYRHDVAKPPGPFKTTPTGDSSADALLALAVDMIKKWGGGETILEARKIWAAIGPRLAELLKQAADPKVGLTPKEVNPGHDALDAMGAWVSRNPGERAIELNYRHKRTPFGTISVTTNIADFARGDDVLGWLQEHEELLVLRPKEVAARQALETKQKSVQKAAGSAAELEKQVKARATKFAQQEAKDFQAAARDAKLVALALTSFRTRLEEAKTALDVAIAQQDATTADKDAAEARALAEEEGRMIDSMLAIVKAGVIMGIEGPIGFIEAIEVVKHVRTDWARTSLAERADELAKRAQHLHSEAARKAVEAAHKAIAAAKPLLEEAEKAAKTIEDDFDLTRAEAEEAYDKNAATFKFADLQQAIELAEQAAVAAEAAAAKARRVRNAAAYFAKQVDWAKRPRFEGGNLQIVESVGNDAKKTLAAVEADAKTIAAAADTLRVLRIAAHQALFTSKDPRKKKKAAAAP